MVRPPPRTADHGFADHDGLVLVVCGDVPRARLQVVGELDFGTAPRLARCLSSLLDTGHLRIDLDVSRLTFLSAAGLTVFCVAKARSEEVGGRLRLTGVTPRVRRILVITGLDTVLLG